jgi:hypothetical protein
MRDSIGIPQKTAFVFLCGREERRSGIGGTAEQL